MSATKTHPLFNKVRKFIRTYVKLDDTELDVVTVWAIGTHTFSPMAPAQPATYPYLYIAGEKGSGKTVLGRDVMGQVCRNHQSTVGTTGAALFRMVGEYDEESGNVISMHPTLAIDEIDATYSGNKDEGLRQMLNAGYSRGQTVPRAAGKSTIQFPVYCPKLLMGIDNGHLPDTVTDRSIRVNMFKMTPEELATEVEPFFIFDMEDAGADELQAEMATWAKDHAMILRDYRPSIIPGLEPRQWEISRSLVQLASELGIEERIRADLVKLFSRKPSGKDALYLSILGLFSDTGLDRVTTRQVLDRLREDGVSVPGGSGKGLAAVLKADGIEPTYLRLREDHPGVSDSTKLVQRGYHIHQFDDVFVKYIDDEDDE